MAMENKHELRKELNITSPTMNISRITPNVSKNIASKTHKVKWNFVANHANVLDDDIESFNEDENSIGWNIILANTLVVNSVINIIVSSPKI